jgi:hypothetical protein
MSSDIHTDECLAATRTRQVLREGFARGFPNYCRPCGGWGVISESEWCPFCVALDRCPRCGAEIISDPDKDGDYRECLTCRWVAAESPGMPPVWACRCRPRDETEDLLLEDALREIGYEFNASEHTLAVPHDIFPPGLLESLGFELIDQAMAENILHGQTVIRRAISCSWCGNVNTVEGEGAVTMCPVCRHSAILPRMHCNCDRCLHPRLGLKPEDVEAINELLDRN